MTTPTIRFELVGETKNAYKYQERPSATQAALLLERVNTIYIRKENLAPRAPQTIHIVVSLVEELV